MARGWDNGGYHLDSASSFRLICGSPPGPGLAPLGGIGAGTQWGYRPNCFCGLTPWDNSPPAIALFQTDFSVECWALQKLLNGPNSDQYFHTGFMGEDPLGFNQPMGCIRYAATTADVLAIYDDVPGVPPGWIFTAWHDFYPRWGHFVVNFNRAGNMDLYTNGRLVESIAINNNNMGNVRFHALSPILAAETQYNDNNDPIMYWGNFSQAKVLVGPMSAHRRLMTLPEIQSSFRGRRVQNFGAAGTWLSWDWRLIERIDGDPIEWTFDEKMMSDSSVSSIQGLGIAAPIGAAGTIRVPDLSGNGNHWVIPTQETYDSRPLETGRSFVSFITHPFWMAY